MMASKRPLAKLTVTPEDIQRMVHVVRGQRVMLDADLAKLYGTTTPALNQAVHRNADRFPEEFAYQLTQQEFTILISQIVISRRAADGTDLTSQGAISESGWVGDASCLGCSRNTGLPCSPACSGPPRRCG
jgi:hypothetical protein